MELKIGKIEACQDLLLTEMPLVVKNGSLGLKALLYWTLAMLILKSGSRDIVNSQSSR